MKLTFKHLAFLGLACFVGTSYAEDMASHSDVVGADGSISLPESYQTEMAHLGSWYVPEGDAAGFHHVYTEPETIEAYQKTGEFPDGAVLVKELRSANTGDFTTGAGVKFDSGSSLQTFVMVKDSKGRYEDNPLWGNGWGWALFRPDSAGQNVATDYQKDCLGCHVPAQNTDWVFVEGYPVLGQ